MPFGPTSMGFVYFGAVKLAGYTAYSIRLRKQYEDGDIHDWTPTFMIGGLRTLIGVAAGVIYGVVAWKGLFGDYAAPVFFIGLIPVRIGEWLLLLRIAFKEKYRDRDRAKSAVGIGILVSYGLDVIGVIAAFAVPGGAWIC